MCFFRISAILKGESKRSAVLRKGSVHANTQALCLRHSCPAAVCRADTGCRSKGRYAGQQFRHTPRGLHRTLRAGAGVLYGHLYLRRRQRAAGIRSRSDEQRNVPPSAYADDGYRERYRLLQFTDKLLAEDRREQRILEPGPVLFGRAERKLQPRACLAEIQSKLRRTQRRMRSAPPASDERGRQLGPRQHDNGQRHRRDRFIRNESVRQQDCAVVQHERRSRRGQQKHQGRRRAHPALRLVPLAGAEPL